MSSRVHFVGIYYAAGRLLIFRVTIFVLGTFFWMCRSNAMHDYILLQLHVLGEMDENDEDFEDEDEHEDDDEEEEEDAEETGEKDSRATKAMPARVNGKEDESVDELTAAIAAVSV